MTTISPLVAEDIIIPQKFSKNEFLQKFSKELDDKSEALNALRIIISGFEIQTVTPVSSTRVAGTGSFSNYPLLSSDLNESGDGHFELKIVRGDMRSQGQLAICGVLELLSLLKEAYSKSSVSSESSPLSPDAILNIWDFVRKFRHEALLKLVISFFAFEKVNPNSTGIELISYPDKTVFNNLTSCPGKIISKDRISTLAHNLPVLKICKEQPLDFKDIVAAMPFVKNLVPLTTVAYEKFLSEVRQ